MDSSSQNKIAQAIEDSFENILLNSKRKPKLIETDRGKEFHSNIFQSLLNINNINHCSRNSSLGVVFAEKFSRSIKDFIHTPVFEKGDCNWNWIYVLSVKTKHYNNRVHTSTKLTPIYASLKKNEGYVYHNLLDNQKKHKPKFKIGELVRTADLRRTFSKRGITNWSYELYKNCEIINDTISSYRLHNIPERYNEALLKKNTNNNERN